MAPEETPMLHLKSLYKNKKIKKLFQELESAQDIIEYNSEILQNYYEFNIEHNIPWGHGCSNYRTKLDQHLKMALRLHQTVIEQIKKQKSLLDKIKMDPIHQYFPRSYEEAIFDFLFFQLLSDAVSMHVTDVDPTWFYSLNTHIPMKYYVQC